MTEQPVGLYVHLPWCVSKCPYCDFNSYTVDGELAEQRYVSALVRDLEMEVAVSGPRLLSSIFFGGGTPSLFSAAAIETVLVAVARHFTLTPDIEITLEANPGSAEAARFADYRQAGINRLSLGVQSFDDVSLAALGRRHTAAEARRAIGFIEAAGFDNFNLDLMFGLPGATAGAALGDLGIALANAPAHLSWYQLTLESGTAFARNPPALPDHDQIVDDYDAGLELLAAAGYTQYEISAHAQRGRQARHNLNYWQFGDYLGVGAGAHGKLTEGVQIIRRNRIRQPERYMRTIEAGRSAAEVTDVAPADRVLEYMLNALRLTRGFTLAEFTERTGIAANDPRLTEPLDAARARGWLDCIDGLVRPSRTGFRFLNELQLLFLPPT